MAEYTVAISTDFFNAFANLPKAKQGRVMEFVSKFRSNPMSPSMNFEKINGAADKNLRSVRIDDTYRAIVMREDGTGVFLLLWVDHHDEAYAWASRRRCVLNKTTGSIQVYESYSSQEETVEQAPAIPPMFAHLADDDFRKLGVPDEFITSVKKLTSSEQLDVLKQKLPQDAAEALTWASEGFSIDEIIDLLYGESETKSDDMASALENAVTKMQFTVVDGEEELKAMMNAPLEKWRVFLHPSQRKLVSKSFNGPARVLGGAGTGKTVVAMHRAKHLAQQCKENERVLFTTFTANLAQDIQENLRKICTIEELRKIDVIHLDAWISRFLQKQDYRYSIKYDEELNDFWRDAVNYAGVDLDVPDGFYEDEWANVVQAQGITSLQDYVKAPRLGRGVRLDRKGRIAAWKVFEEYKTQMDVNQVRDSATAMNECCQIMKEMPDYHPYKAIVVDEGQDFGMSAFRLIRAIAGAEHQNDIFIVGDAHQRIYRNKVTLSKCGINVRGRSSQLKINYRTTEEIRSWAMHVLTGIAFDDLDGGQDDARGYMSLSHGLKPTVSRYTDLNAEVNGIIEAIKAKLDAGVLASDICIVARTNKMLDDYEQALSGAGIRTFKIKRSKNDDRSMPGIRLATMHRVKGLEFGYMFLVGVNKDIVPLKNAIRSTDPVAYAEALTGERCLLYVALTRAKREATITGYGELSEFVK